MDARYLQAFTDPAPVRLLGRMVWPFCLKHRVRLMALGSPILEGRPSTPLDLLVAVKVCAEEPIGRPGLLDTWRLAQLNRDPARFEAELRRFAEYALVGCWPKFWEKKTTGGTTSSVPWPLAVLANLIASGIEEQRAWEMPECQAIWLNVALVARKGGDVNVLSTEEEELMDALRAAEVAEAARVNDGKA
jgi:hypothetical protein